MSNNNNVIQSMDEQFTVEEKMQFTSIYIPNLPEDLMLSGRPVSSEAELKYFFEVQFPLGIVRRVDIASRPNRNSNGSHIRCAFVHFENWHLFAHAYRYILVAEGEFRLYGDINGQLFYSSSNRAFGRYINIKINKAPIAEVPALEAEKMNIHQLVDNYRRLEKQLEMQAEKIHQLTATVQSLTTDLYDEREKRVYFERVAENRLQIIHDIDFELSAARCSMVDAGEEPSDGGPLTMEELTVGIENV